MPPPSQFPPATLWTTTAATRAAAAAAALGSSQQQEQGQEQRLWASEDGQTQKVGGVACPAPTTPQARCLPLPWNEARRDHPRWWWPRLREKWHQSLPPQLLLPLPLPRATLLQSPMALSMLLPLPLALAVFMLVLTVAKQRTEAYRLRHVLVHQVRQPWLRMGAMRETVIVAVLAVAAGTLVVGVALSAVMTATTQTEHLRRKERRNIGPRPTAPAAGKEATAAASRGEGEDTDADTDADEISNQEKEEEE